MKRSLPWIKSIPLVPKQDEGKETTREHSPTVIRENPWWLQFVTKKQALLSLTRFHLNTWRHAGTEHMPTKPVGATAPTLRLWPWRLGCRKRCCGERGNQARRTRAPPPGAITSTRTTDMCSLQTPFTRHPG